MSRRVLAAAALLAAALLAAGSPAGASRPVPAAAVTLPGGTIATDTRVGTGAVAAAGQTVTVNYTGWLDAGAGRHGTMFDSSVGKTPFVFALGAGDVIPGWDAGVAGMKVGGRRTLVVPAAQGYGERGAGGVIPPGATLIFDVELLKVE